jgi:UDP-N-acetylglucosamine transferase subunit ALG13
VIFVTVGTNEARFERLLRAVAALPSDEPFVIQHGHSPAVGRPNCELVDFLPFAAMVETMRRARVVVTHAGVGSVMVALANGKRPVVVPRRKAFGEAVDDHQLQLGRRFAQAGFVTLAETEPALADAVGREDWTATLPNETSALADELRGFLEGVITRSPVRP